MTDAERIADLRERISASFHGETNEDRRELVAELNALTLKTSPEARAASEAFKARFDG
jgi:hypothetical protein